MGLKSANKINLNQHPTYEHYHKKHTAKESTAIRTDI